MVAASQPPGEAQGGAPTTMEQLEAQVRRHQPLGGQAGALHCTGARPLTAPLPPPRRLSSPLRCPSRHCPGTQAVAFQHLMALESLPLTGREVREAARGLGAVMMASAAPAPLLSQLVAEYLDSLPPARARFVDVSTGT